MSSTLHGRTGHDRRVALRGPRRSFSLPRGRVDARVGIEHCGYLAPLRRLVGLLTFLSRLVFSLDRSAVRLLTVTLMTLTVASTLTLYRRW